MCNPPNFFNIILILICILAIFWWLRLFEYHNVYHPMKRIELRPEEFGFIYEDITFHSSDNIKLSGWFFNSEKPKASLLFCHGNAGNISHRLEIVKILRRLSINIFLFDYRGYGLSEGSPSEEGTYLDAVSAFDYLKSRNGSTNLPIITYGESLGGAVGAELALRRDVAALIIEGSFTSVPDLGKELFPFLPIHLAGKIQYDSLSKIGKIKCPVLIIHSKDDEIISISHGEKLYDAARPPKDIVIRRGSHSEGMFANPQVYTDKIADFLAKYVFK